MAKHKRSSNFNNQRVSLRVAWATQQDPVPPVSKEKETDRQQEDNIT